MSLGEDAGCPIERKKEGTAGSAVRGEPKTSNCCAEKEQVSPTELKKGSMMMPERVVPFRDQHVDFRNRAERKDAISARGQGRNEVGGGETLGAFGRKGWGLLQALDHGERNPYACYRRKHRGVARRSRSLTAGNGPPRYALVEAASRGREKSLTDGTVQPKGKNFATILGKRIKECQP